MKEKFNQIKKDILAELERTETLEQLDEFYSKYFSRNSGKFSKLVRDIKQVDKEYRPVVGKIANDVKKEVTEAYELVKSSLEKKYGPTQQLSNKLDITRPGYASVNGSLHPITQVKRELNDAFRFLGFEIYQGLEISSEEYVFDKLNFPKDHPARESMDTYWLANQKSKSQKITAKEKLCLRPHLTGASVRYMQTHQPPFRFIYPGRVFRSETTDAGHERCFYQWEALMVNKTISISGGKILVKSILERVFKREVEIRMRSGFFPFVEPGFEIDIRCLNCGGKGCSVCKHNGWVEMMPGGPPHANVLRAGGIDPAKWQGFYINIGLDRIVMMKYGIHDIRLMHSGDLRFLEQF